jgi:phytoene dehydrogenase-like protein
MARTVDAVVVGSGINGLVAAAYLAGAGWSVEVLERNEQAGGAIATEELTVPGYRHDTFSSWHPLFHLSAAYQELGDALAARGLRYVNTDEQTTAGIGPEQAPVIAYRDPGRTAEGLLPADGARYLAELERLGGRMPAIGELLSLELHSGRAVRSAFGLARSLGRREVAPFVSEVILSLRGWLHRFGGPELARLYTPWVLHTGMTPEQSGSGFSTLAIAGALHAVGLPIVAGGASGFVDAISRYITDHGGSVRTGCEVTEISVCHDRAAGVRTADEEVLVRRGIVANVTPTQLYGRLLAPASVPPAVAEEAARYRYNARAGAQLHIALSEPPRWRDERLDTVPLVHINDGLDGVVLSCAQAAAGLLPARPTIACGQPTVLDPSRAPDGGAVLWIQLQEVPYAPRLDAAGEIDVGPAGWDDALTSAYADRIIARLAEHVTNLPEAIVGRRMLSPVELERRNPNLVRGDIYSGDAELSQSYLWRPLPSFGSHATPIDGLYHCGASTFPGAGLNPASGRIAAQQLLGAGRSRITGWFDKR